jgi:hypothetical protein
MGKAAYCTGLLAVCFLPLIRSSAWAATQPVTFNACISARTGNLYNLHTVAAPQCRSGDKVTSWNQTDLGEWGNLLCGILAAIGSAVWYYGKVRAYWQNG